MAATVVPVPNHTTAQPTSSYASSTASNYTSNRQTPIGQPVTTPATGVSMIEATRSTSGFVLPSSFPELEKMTVLQLQRLLNDEVSLQVMLALKSMLYAIFNRIYIYVEHFEMVDTDYSFCIF